MKEYVNNSIPFYQLVGGQYGRKIAYTDVQSITPENVEKVVADGREVHNNNKPAFLYLWKYYKGDQPIHYRTKSARDDILNKVEENHAYEIVQFKCGQTYGEPVQFISRRDDDSVNKAVERLNDYMVNADKQSKDIKSGEWQSATGTSFKAVQRKEGDIPFRIVAPTPLNTFAIYSRETEEAMLSVQELKDENGEEYLLCFSENMQFTIKDGKLTDKRLHAFGGIPVIEYPNNWERISDIELVIDLLDTINNYQSNRIDGVEQFVQSWVKFVNCELDPQQWLEMRQTGALVVKSNNGSENRADVDLLTQDMNQTESQVAKDDLIENAYTILAIPSKETNASGGDSQGAIQLKNGWDVSKSRAKMKDPLVKQGDKKLGLIVNNLLRLSGEDLGLKTMDFDVVINHSPQDNMSVKAMTMGYLLQNGIHPKIAIDRIGLFEDSEKVYLQSKPYLDHLWKTIDDEKAEQTEGENTQTYSFGTSQTGQAQKAATGGMAEPQTNNQNT